MVLLFKVDDAVRKLLPWLAQQHTARLGGETIRDTYGDLIIIETTRFLLRAGSSGSRHPPMKLKSSSSSVPIIPTRRGIAENVIPYQPAKTPQRHAGFDQA